MASPNIEPLSQIEQRQDDRRVSLVFPYGFIDKDGTHRFWQAGQSVRDPEELAMLEARGVHLKED